MSAYSDRILSLAPLAYYRLGEASGTNAADSSGHANNGTYGGSPVLGAAGAIGDGTTALKLDGVDDVVSFPTSLVVNVGSSITVEWWQYLLASDVVFSSAFSIGTANSPSRCTSHAPYTDNILYWDHGDTVGGRVTTSYVPYLGKWTHIVLTYDAATNKHAITLNGVEVASTINATAPTAQLVGGRIAAGFVGAAVAARGVVDEFAVYNYALSPSDRLANYNARLADLSAYAKAVLGDGPRGYWRLGESAVPVLDSSGNGTDFASSGGSPLSFSQPSLLASDPANKSIGFFNGWLSRGPSAALDVRDVFTVEAWVKLQTLTNGYQSIYSHWTGGLYLRLSNANQLQLLASGAALICTSTVAISDLNTHHVVATKNGATVKLYIDGVDVTGSVTNYTFASAPGWFGMFVDAAGSGEPPNMTGDEVALYPVALSQAQVLAHYNAGVTSPSSPQTVPVSGLATAQSFGVPVAKFPPKTVAITGVGSAGSLGSVTTMVVVKVAVPGATSAQQFGALSTIMPPQIVQVPGLPQQTGTTSIVGGVISGDGHVVGGLGSLFGFVTVIPGRVFTTPFPGVGSAQQFGTVWIAFWQPLPVRGLPSAQLFGAVHVYNVWLYEVPCVGIDLDGINCATVTLTPSAEVTVTAVPITLDLTASEAEDLDLQPVG